MTSPSEVLRKKGLSRVFWLVILTLPIGIGWAAGKFWVGRTPAVPAQPAEFTVSNDDSPASPDHRPALLFGVYCASCHGPDGRGDGPSSATIKPPPRDFAARPWRYSVTRESIRNVIRDGIPGTAMAASRAAIAPSDVDRLVEYTYQLATARPPISPERTEQQKLLQAAGFIDLQGIVPPQLNLVDARGQEMSLSELRGQLVLLHFWGANCPHCLKEMPGLKTLEAELSARGFSVLHVCTDREDAKESQALADRFATGLKIVIEGSGLGVAPFEVQSLPSVWLIAPDGKAIARATGARNWSAPAIRSLLDSWLPR